VSTLQIKPVTTRRERKEFLNFPWRLYRNDPYWIPPLRANQAEMVGYRPHPFYETNRAQTFLAYRDGELCGRVAAIRNQWHIDLHQENLGFFGFFECIDDQEVANGLLDAVRDWFAPQGITWLRGPANPSQSYEFGLLVEGFDSSPTFMMTYNPPYYGQLLTNYGFRKSQDLYAYWGHREMLPPIRDKLAPLSKKIIEHLGLKLRPMDKSRFKEDVRTFLSIFNRSMATSWGFVPISEKEMDHMAGGLRYLLIPEMSIAAEVDGKVVGALFSIPDYNPRIRAIDGRLFPFGLIRLLWRRRLIKRVRMVSTNVLPEYQILGVGLALMAAAAPKLLDWGVQECEFSWVLESNNLSRGSLEKGGAKRTKTYRMYDLNAPAASSNGSKAE
jgi:GNAT superfamily N-acetyltransferase